MAVADLTSYGIINDRTKQFMYNSLATEHFHAHNGKIIVDVGILGKALVILFESNEQLTFEMIGQLTNTTEPSALVGGNFEGLSITNNFMINEDCFRARVFISARFGSKSTLMTANYTIPLMRTLESDIYPARVYTTILNEEQPCHAIQETTKKNTKPMTELPQSEQRGQNETKQDESCKKKGLSTKAMAKTLTTLNLLAKGAELADPTCVLETLLQTAHTQEPRLQR